MSEPLALPKDVSLPSLLDMASSAADGKGGGGGTPGTASGTASSLSSDRSAASQPPTSSPDDGGCRPSVSAHVYVAAAMEALEKQSKEQHSWYYYLTPEAARRLPEYQYHGADLSPLYKYVLSPFAAWCVENHTPEWLAPNAITLLGLGWMLLAYSVIWFYCPGMYESNTDLGGVVSHAVPGVIFLLNGCAMLVYQTLDNMDGKQARKTGSSSPLGLLFDHGCDAMNSILGSANWIAAMAMVPGNVGDLAGGDADLGDNVQNRSLPSQWIGGDAFIAALLILFPMVAFYVSTWEQYYTGKLILPPFNGPSEGLLMGASLSILSFFWGPMYWQGTSLADGALDLLGPYFEEGSWQGVLLSSRGRVRNMDLIAIASIVGLAQEIVVRIMFVTRKHGIETLRTLFPNAILLACTIALVRADPTLFLRCPRMTMHLISGLFVEQTTQLMVDHMVEEKFEVKRWSLFPYICLAAGAMGGLLSHETADTLILVYTSGLWVYLAFKIRVYLYEICDVLGIWIFDIVTPHPKKQSTAGGMQAVDSAAKKTN